MEGKLTDKVVHPYTASAVEAWDMHMEGEDTNPRSACAGGEGDATPLGATVGDCPMDGWAYTQTEAETAVPHSVALAHRHGEWVLAQLGGPLAPIIENEVI